MAQPKRENYTLETVNHYLRRGWRVVPVEYKGKKPIVEDWPNFIIDVAKVHEWFSTKSNVGVVLGKASDWLVDVDLDDLQAIDLARDLLPSNTSSVFGHGVTRRASHYLYRCKGLSKGIKYVWDKKTLLELHSNGRQTVFPGSVHISGEPIVWLNGFNPASIVPDVEQEELTAACGMLAGAVLLQQFWKEGIRDNLAVALNGVLARGDWQPVEIDHYIGVVAAAAGDDSERVKALYQHDRLARGAPVPGIPTLERLIGVDGKRTLLEWLGLGGGDIVSDMNNLYASVLIGGKHRVMVETSEGVAEFVQDNALMKQYENKLIRMNGKYVNPVKHWMGHANRREYDKLVFNPDASYAGRSREYNFWRGFTTEPSPLKGENLKRQVQPYLDHVYDNICRGDMKLYEYVMAWLGDLVQRPCVRPGVALVLRGGEGIGKGMFVRPWLDLYGTRHGVHFSQHRHLTGHFNSQFKDRMLVYADEVTWGGDVREEGALKGLITEPTMLIEYKGLEPFAVPCYFRMVIAGNKRWIVPAGIGSRRFCVLDVGEKRKEDREYFSRVLAVDRAAILKYFMEYGSGNSAVLDIVYQPPVTKGLMEMRKLSLDPVHGWYMERLKEGVLVTGEPWTSPVSVRRVLDAFTNRARPTRSTEVSFGMQFKQACPGLRKVRKFGIGYFYILPPLDQCRADFEIAILCLKNRR